MYVHILEKINTIFFCFFNYRLKNCLLLFEKAETEKSNNDVTYVFNNKVSETGIKVENV